MDECGNPCHHGLNKVLMSKVMPNDTYIYDKTYHSIIKMDGHGNVRQQ